MSMKFGKNREVHKYYLNVPYKYILTYHGSNHNSKYKVFGRAEAIDEIEKKYPELKALWLDYYINPTEESIAAKFKCEKMIEEILEREHKKNKDKSLCIVDFYGKNKALVAWRNNTTCKMGMTRLCKIIHKKHGRYLLYRGNEIFIDNPSGWVI